MEEAFKNASTLGYFNSAQAIADYAEILIHVKKELHAQHSPVIVIGGSYGGMLAAWLRLKYPHVALGALASSAPVLYFDNIGAPENGYYSIVSRDFRRTWSGGGEKSTSEPALAQESSDVNQKTARAGSFQIFSILTTFWFSLPESLEIETDLRNEEFTHNVVRDMKKANCCCSSQQSKKPLKFVRSNLCFVCLIWELKK
ncbi:hypothetical protein ACE6H2_018989 [Prunus campanulata]